MRRLLGPVMDVQLARAVYPGQWVAESGVELAPSERQLERLQRQADRLSKRLRRAR